MLHSYRISVLTTLLLVVFLLSVIPSGSSQVTPQTATITVDTLKVENKISPLLYGQFIEHMFEGVKFGLHAELLRDRSFEESPNAIGLPRYWDRYPDDRVDDYALTFYWDSSVFYPPARHFEFDANEPRPPEHSVRVDAGNGVIKRHGFYQSGIRVKAKANYNRYLWLRSETGGNIDSH
jgi:hypothetical protein